MNRQDVLNAPAYSIAEAARYLHLPPATLRSWVVGRLYPVSHGRRRSRPIILPADPSGKFLSFINLVEAHVLSSIRRQHNVSLQNVRKAVEYLCARFQSKWPLSDQQLETDGIDLFVEKLGKLINISRHGQIEMRDVLKMHLRRIDRDSHGVPIRLYPFTKSTPDGQHTGLVVIDPAVSFGRPMVGRIGVPTAVIAERYKAGETIDDLARDYGAKADEIEEAIRCELELRAA